MKKGRPIINNKRNRILHVRLNKEEEKKLKDICYDYDISKSDFIRMAINKYYRD